MSLTQQAHQAILSHLNNLGKTQLRFSIDATCGNGFDTLFLAQNTKEMVFSFDVQETALNSTKLRLNKASNQTSVTLVHASHSSMIKHCEKTDSEVFGNVDAIMFNLGYLPRADKTITTSAESTMTALNAAIELLSPKGIITVICYRGHNGGLAESKAVLSILNANKQLCYETIDSIKASETTPFLLVIKRKST